MQCASAALRRFCPLPPLFFLHSPSSTLHFPLSIPHPPTPILLVPSTPHPHSKLGVYIGGALRSLLPSSAPTPTPDILNPIPIPIPGLLGYGGTPPIIPSPLDALYALPNVVLLLLPPPPPPGRYSELGGGWSHPYGYASGYGYELGYGYGQGELRLGLMPSSEVVIVGLCTAHAYA